MKALDCFFEPENVAVIGASNERESIGYALFENFVKGRFRNKCFAVNPNHKKVQGKKSYASIKDIPGKVYLAVIAVPAKIVPFVLEECMEKKVCGAIIISAGFAEVGEKRLTRKLQRLIGRNPKTRVLGPNCFGVLYNGNGLNTTFSEKRRQGIPKKGGVSFMSQSGALGVAILDWISTQEFGINKFVSYGNAMDIDEADLLEHLGKDEETKVITVYLEGVKEGRKFLKAAKKISMKKPIIAIKGGVTEEAHAATASHTGSMAGSAAVYNAVFRQAGIIQANDLLELFNFAKTFENEPLPKGNRVMVITNGGGFGIVTADQVVENGLRLAKFGRESERKLRREMPSTVTVRNPLDLVGDADARRYKTAIESALKDKNIDMVMVLILFNTPTLDRNIVSVVGKLRKKAKKPMVVVSVGSEYTKRMKKAIEKQGAITFSYPSVAAKSLKALWDYRQFRERH